MHYFEIIPLTLHPLTWRRLGSPAWSRPLKVKESFKGWNVGTTRVERCYVWITMTTKTLPMTVLLFLCWLAHSQLQTSFRYAFRCSSEASTPRTWNAHTDALVCGARCQFWRPQAPTLASYRADAGFADDLSLERDSSGRCNQRQTSLAGVTESSIETSKEGKNRQKKKA